MAVANQTNNSFQGFLGLLRGRRRKQPSEADYRQQDLTGDIRDPRAEYLRSGRGDPNFELYESAPDPYAVPTRRM